MELHITRKQVLGLLALMLSFAFLARLAMGVGFFNSYDTYWYRSWAVDLAENGLFTAYGRMKEIALDYPPVYLIFLYITGLGYKALGGGVTNDMQMLLLKFWPVLFDVACAGLLYLICRRRYGRPAGLLAAFFWTLNPSFFFNTAGWGQTDGVMAFALLLTFWLLEENRPVAACAAMAVAGLTKFQCLFFLPPFLIVLFLQNRKRLLRPVLGLLAAALTVLLVFLPFMIGAKNPMLFFDLYLGSAGKYDYCTLHAYNLYCMLGLNWTHDVKDTDPMLGSFTWQGLSYVFLFLSLALLVWLYVISCRRHGEKRLNGWVGGLLFMQCVFMLTTRMHERYQIIVLPFALMAWVSTRRGRFLGLFAGLTGITLVNQYLVLINVVQNKLFKATAFYLPARDTLEIIFSAVNMLLFLWTVYECVDYLAGGPSKPSGQIAGDGGAALSAAEWKAGPTGGEGPLLEPVAVSPAVPAVGRGGTEQAASEPAEPPEPSEPPEPPDPPVPEWLKPLAADGREPSERS
ncbi:MAG: DUF2029 domain-containing protein [Clostridiales bacterium]|nr:DUF2029 domain-containing protein [Clostridiales bacterium]